MSRIEHYIHKRLNISEFNIQPFVSSNNITRETLALLFNDLEYTIGAEIGVLRGYYSEVLCKNNSRLKLYCIDSWEPRGSIKMEKYYNLAIDKLSKYNTVIIRKTSVEASKNIKDNSLDFVYIDGCHDFDNVMLDLIHWVPKVKYEGIIAGHDYRDYPGLRVIPAVNAYRLEHTRQPLYLTGDKFPSFLWVKR